MYLEIITPEKVILKEEIDSVTIPTVTGEITVLPNHINLLTQIIPGEMIVKINRKNNHLAITGGFLQINHNNLTLLANYAIRSEEIDIEKAIAAQKRAEEILNNKEKGLTEQDFATAHSEMGRAILEIKVAKKRRRNNPQLQ